MPGKKSKTPKKSVTTSPDLNITANGKSFDVPVEGSLGLLALGAAGLLAWRKKRKESIK